MYTEKQIERLIKKLVRFEDTLHEQIFVKVDQMDMKWFRTPERLYQIPADDEFTACQPGDEWQGPDEFCWYKGTYQPKAEFDGQTLYLYPKATGYEALLWVDGQPKGIFAAKFVVQTHGNHYCDMLTKAADSSQKMDIALEYFSGNYCVGSMPLVNDEKRDFKYHADVFDICVKDDLIADFYFSLHILDQIAETLDTNSFRRAEIVNALIKVHDCVYYAADDVDQETFRAALIEAYPYMQEVLEHHNADSAPTAAVIGHSHMDTAWLWTIDETIKKCARTYSNQLSLMEQYPEYLFVQSSAYHTELVRRYYPELFERIREQIAAGRYEPNGGVWVECDCNIPSGEMIARQFIWGQNYTREHFGYLSDTFWLPDTFGYNGAIPQIMKGSHVKYFMTTKLDWNDTNKFPYDTFYWKGIDGTSVLTHFNKTHVWPDPESLIEFIDDGKVYDNAIKEKSVTDKRMISFGYGDGGGGPEFEMLELARRLGDVDGVPKVHYTRVSDFMQTLEREIQNPSTYHGELYLELHRGTLTNQHQIKRNNRLAEIALHDLEYLTVRQDAADEKICSDEAVRPLMETLLVNQFHDILPGTCIPEVHERSRREVGEVIAESREKAQELMKDSEKRAVTVSNTTSFVRNDVCYLDCDEKHTLAADYPQQHTQNIKGESKLVVSGIELLPFSSRSFELSSGNLNKVSQFIWDGRTLETPFAVVTFDENGGIDSFRDKTENGRELRDPDGFPLNTFMIAEDVPYEWDNWDIDADLAVKMKPVKHLLSSEVISSGAVEFRMRNKYQISRKSTIIQDIVFYADSPLVSFETQMNWNDHHRFLKTAFDTTIYADEARHEIQFGYVKRPTTENNSQEKAQFEVCAHKYTDLSEMRYGVAVLNDSKYGVSVRGQKIWLSLHKGGTRPDYKGDTGIHYCSYAFLPHQGGFSAAEVVKPAYLYNYHSFVSPGHKELAPLLQMDSDHVIIDTVKPCEQAEKAYILRLYECEGASGPVHLSVPQASAIEETDMLETGTGYKGSGNTITLDFHPFQVRTLKVHY